jgi:2-methylisocitrate lyase-like PEP mutase family enzyme
VTSQADLVRRLRELHAQPPLVLPNAWDAGSARAIEAAGAAAIATTSAGVSWALGVEDAGGLSRATAVAALRSIVDAVSIPVTRSARTASDTCSSTASVASA